MKAFAIAEAVDLTDADSTNAVSPDETPFLPGREAVLVLDTVGMTGGSSPSFKVEGSDDDDTYTALLTYTAAKPVLMANITIPKYLRVTVTSASTAGTANAYLLGGV